MDLKYKWDNYFISLESKYVNNGEISWEEFNKDQLKNRYKVVLLKQKDFKYGTLRVKEPCMVKLMENIYFNPNRPETWLDKEGKLTDNFEKANAIDPNRGGKNDWWPNVEQINNKQYFEKDVKNAYTLGFFAALTLENENIIVNLNNYIMEQHTEHALQQRFFSIIELADQPFIPKQGPANFGRNLRCGGKICIRNGKLGLSSHHGIHGNLSNVVVIKNVDFTDNEVCAIALNGNTNIILENINILRNRHNIPVMGTYSAGRFLKLFTERIKDGIKETDIYSNTLKKLNEDLDATFNSVIFKNGSVPSIYENSTGLIDGNPYGILINHLGVAVGPPLENRKTSKANQNCNLYANCVSVNNLSSNINEVLALQNSDGKPITAPSGAIFQFFSCSKKIDDKYYYEGNSLSDLQIELVRLKQDNPNISSLLGNFRLDEILLKWKDNKKSYFTHSVNKIIGSDDLNNKEYNILGNGDSMFHVNKGTFGFRVQGLNSGIFHNIDINEINTISAEGDMRAGQYLKSHPQQAHLNGYQGNKCFGLVLTACNDVVFENTNVNCITSEHGSSYGIYIDGESNKIKLQDTIVQNIKSSQTPFNSSKEAWPNEGTVARGICVKKNAHVEIDNITFKNIIPTPNCLNEGDTELHSLVKLK